MKKKIISFLSIAILLVNMLVASVFAEAAPTITAGNAEGKAGETVEIPIMLSNNTGFADIGVEIGYDNTALKLIKVTENSSVGTTFMGAQELTVNPYNMGWKSNYNNAYNGNLATLTFEIITDSAGVYPIMVDYYKGRNGNYKDGNNVNYDENFVPLGLRYVDGSITVKKKGSSGSMSVGGISFDISLGGDADVGTVWAATYDSDGKLNDLKKYPAAESVKVALDVEETDDYVKIMWWNEMEPMCRGRVIPLK